MPRLWSDTIEAHRRAVRDATLDTAAALVAANGRSAVTMSRIAEDTGIGRATLYKYFSDVEAILVAWHERQITQHLDQLTQVRDRTAAGGQRLAAVLTEYAGICYAHHDSEFAAELHRGEHVARARVHLLDFVEKILVGAVQCGEVRDDVPTSELASFCVHALSAAASLRTNTSVERLVAVTLAGVRPPG